MNKEKTLKHDITRLRKVQNPSPTDLRRMRTLRDKKTQWWGLQKKPSEGKVAAATPKPEKKEETPAKPEKEPELEVVDEELDELYDIDEKEESTEK